jgi:hypothetical protein
MQLGYHDFGSGKLGQREAGAGGIAAGAVVSMVLSSVGAAP